MASVNQQMEVDRGENEVFSTPNAVQMAAITVSEEELMHLNHVLRLQSEVTESGSELSEAVTDESDAIITESAGSVQQIKGLFQGLNEEEHGQHKLGSDESSRPSSCVNAPLTKEALLRKVQVLKRNESKHDKCNSDNNKSANHDKFVCTANKTGNKGGKDKTSKTPKTPKKNKKKRKLNSESVEKENIEEDQSESVISEKCKKASLYPIFAKIKDSDSDARASIKADELGMEGINVQDSDTEVTQGAGSLDEQNLQVVDIRTVISMMKKMETKIKDVSSQKKASDDGLKEYVSEALEKAKKDMKKDNMDDIEAAFKHYEEEIKTLKAQLKEQKSKTQLISGVLQMNQGVTRDVMKKISELEMESYRKSVILTGLRFSTSKDERIRQIEQFFLDALGVRVKVDDTYFIGSKQSGLKPVVITLQTLRDKNVLFKRKEELNKLEGENGSAIYLNSYLPPDINEKKRRERDILKDLKKTKTKYEKLPTGIKIGATHYKKKISAPDPTEVLDMEMEELERILSLDVVKGDTLKVKDSLFVPYSADVQNFKNIRESYMKIRLMHARARHIVCAYYLPGAEIYHNQDYVDDEESGAGRAVLKLMQENNISNKAFYIVRICGKERLNENRISSYVAAATSVQNMNSFNAILNGYQPVNANPTDVDKSRGRAGKGDSNGNGKAKTKYTVNPVKTTPPAERRITDSVSTKLYADAARQHHTERGRVRDDLD